MSPKELNLLLVEKAEAALRYLFGEAGQYSGSRFSIGNIQGESGDSLFVYLKQGRFVDSATGEKGDLLELFSLRHGSKKAGIDAAYTFLGKPKPIAIGAVKERKKKVVWKKPEKEWTQLTENPTVLAYLVEERKIAKPILLEAKVKGFEDEAYCFLTFNHEAEPVECGANYIDLERRLMKSGKLKKKIRQSENPLSVLFGHPSCKLGVKADKSHKKGFLVITGGQIDCLSMRTQSIGNCVSVPFGEQDTGWIQNSWDWMMENFDEFYLLFDNDDTGEDYTEKVANKIGYDRCKKCYLPSEYNDPNEAHIKGYDLNKCIENAAPFKPSKIESSDDLREETFAELTKGRRELQGIPFLGWEDINFRIRPAEMTIVTGYPGHGKSNMLYQAIADLIMTHGESIVVASLEEDAPVINALIWGHALGFQYDPNDEKKCNAYQAVADEIGQRLFYYHYRGQAKFEELLDAAEFCIRKYGAKHFILDSVAKTDLNIDDKEQAAKFISKLTASMNQTKAHYWIVAHSRKGNDKDFNEIPGLQEIKGDNSFGIQCFNCLSVWRHSFKDVAIEQVKKGGGNWKLRPDREGNSKSLSAEDIKFKPNTILTVCKQKVGGQTGRFDVFYNPDNYRLHRDPDFEDRPTYAQHIIDKCIHEEDDDYT